MSPTGSAIRSVRRRSLIVSVAVALSTVIVAGGVARAAAVTWGGGSGNWNTPGKWSGGGVPGTADDVTISAGTVTIDSGTNKVTSVTITGGTVGFSGSSTLTVSGAFSISDGAFTGGSGAISIGGNLAMTGGTFTGGSGAITVTGSVNANVVSSGSDPSLVGYWTFDDTASPAVDSSGNGNNLTWSGTPTATTSHSAAITFTDSHSLAMTGGQAATTSSTLSSISALRPSTVTVSAWYKATSIDTNGAEIVSGSNTYGLRISSSGLVVMKRISDNTSKADWIEYRVPESGILDGSWHQIVGVISTGTGGSMTAYFDGLVAAGAYWVNGSNGASQLTSSSTPTIAQAAADIIDWDTNTETFGLVVGNNPSTTGYQFGGSAGGGTKCTGSNCAIDEVRVYNRALTAGQIAALASGNLPGGTAGILSLAGAFTATGGMTIQSPATLTMASGSTLSIGSGQSLTIDGTLNATGGTITSAGTFGFHVGSTATASPTLNISALAVSKTDANGMWIGFNAAADTTFSEFDNIAFSSGTSGGTLLKIVANTLYLTSKGCTFDGSAGTGTTKYAVTLIGNGSSGSSTETRAVFGGSKCATNWAVSASDSTCAATSKSDDDNESGGGNGVSDSPGNGVNFGAVVQFVRSVQNDTAGSVVGLPTAAFSWTTFTYYSTYVAFHNGALGGTSDIVYVRDEAGNALYSWTVPTAGETITGTPQWNIIGGTHYLFVATSAGHVYKLIDTATGTTGGTLTLDTASTNWSTANPYDCACTISTPLGMDATNLYWGSTTGTSNFWTLGQSNQSHPTPITLTQTVTNAGISVATIGSTAYAFMGVTGSVLAITSNAVAATNNSPGTHSVFGRIAVGQGSTKRVYAGDDGGTMWAIDPTTTTTFGTANGLWKYNTANAIKSGPYYDLGTDSLQYGTQGERSSCSTEVGRC